MKSTIKFIFFFILLNFSNLNAKENIMILKLKTGDVKIELFQTLHQIMLQELKI